MFFFVNPEYDLDPSQIDSFLTLSKPYLLKQFIVICLLLFENVEHIGTGIETLVKMALLYIPMFSVMSMIRILPKLFTLSSVIH